MQEKDGEREKNLARVYGDDREGGLGLYLREMAETPLLKRNEERALAKRVAEGDEAAREQMILANLRFVVSLACEYKDRGLPLADLINEGNIGLMKGVDKFDPENGAKVSTYAAWWIKQSIKSALADQSKTIRIPIHLVDRIAKIKRVAQMLHAQSDHEPTDEEIAAEMQMTPERVTELITASYRPVSLDAPVGDDNETLRSELIMDERAGNASEDVETAAQHEMVLNIISTLNAKEQRILRERFGLYGEDEKTLEEIGQEFGVTRERIRQIESVALKKIRRAIERLEKPVDR